jgi:hypothetical protein
MEVLADDGLTNFAKALKLGRTYQSVRNAVQRNGYTSAVGLGDPANEQWLIDNPNAGRVEEIRAQFESITGALAMPAPELETAGAPKRPVFDWED